MGENGARNVQTAAEKAVSAGTPTGVARVPCRWRHRGPASAKRWRRGTVTGPLGATRREPTRAYQWVRAGLGRRVRARQAEGKTMSASAPARSPGPARQLAPRRGRSAQGQRRGRCGAASARATKEAPSANGRARSPTLRRLLAARSLSLGRSDRGAAARRSLVGIASAAGALCSHKAGRTGLEVMCIARRRGASSARHLAAAGARSLATLVDIRRHARSSSALLERLQQPCWPVRGPLPDAGRRGLRAPRHDANSPKFVLLAAHSCWPSSWRAPSASMSARRWAWRATDGRKAVSRAAFALRLAGAPIRGFRGHGYRWRDPGTPERCDET